MKKDSSTQWGVATMKSSAEGGQASRVMLQRIVRGVLATGAVLSISVPSTLFAEALCRNKETSEVIARKTCRKGEVKLSTLEVGGRSTQRTASSSTGLSVDVQDQGAVASGTDTNTALDVSMRRISATGGTLNTTGLNVEVTGDTGGDSTNVGLSVTTSGADNNYSAIFQGGNVGIGVSDPDEALEVAGRINLGATTAPGVTANKLYNVGGTLFWGGQAVNVGAPSEGGGTITGVTAGTGLAGGGTSGNVTLSVNSGTAAGNIVQLNSSAELPAVSGANLTSLNASSLASGSIADARLSPNVSLLGSSIGLSSSEVSGVLPLANGGTGATSLSNLISLGSHTTGNYVASVGTGTGLSGGASGSESAALTLSVDQAFSPTWTGTHSFQGSVNVGTTTASPEALHLNGRLHLEPSSAPSTTTDKLYNVGGALFFNGQNLTTGAAGGDITGITAGTGLTGTTTSGEATLAVDVGTTANDIVQLNGSAQLPAVSGVNLTNLNASNLASGTVPIARLAASVSLFGSSVDLSGSEVTGILGVANGGTGASSLNDLVTLGTHSTGNYVAGVTAGTGILVSGSGSEGATPSVSLDQSVAATWTSGHTFSGVATDITTVSNQDFAIVPNGTGGVGIGTNTPSAKLDTVLTSTSSTAATEIGAEFNLADSGAVNTGTDNSTGAAVVVSRTGGLSGGTFDTKGLTVAVTGDTGGTSTATGIDVLVSGADTNYAATFRGGNVGIGVASPTALLHSSFSTTESTAGTQTGNLFSISDTGTVASGTDTTRGVDISVTRTGGTGGTIAATGLRVGVTGDTAGAGTSRTVGLDVSVSGADTNLAAAFSGGSVVIGSATGQAIDTDIDSGSLVIDDGALCVDSSADECGVATRMAGTIYAEAASVTAMDLAEQFPVAPGDEVHAGEIVMLNTQKAEKCLRWKRSADGDSVCEEPVIGNIPFVTRSDGDPRSRKRILGIVSTEPGIALGGFGDRELKAYKKVPIALAGRIPMKVSLENGVIEPGDRVTISSEPGVGMKAGPTDYEIGVALEPFDGQGASDDPEKILVLVK